MGISDERFRTHTNTWLGKFTNYKRKWPKHLFRHEPITNALTILKAGVLKSRDGAAADGILQNDIAPENIIQARDDAHNCVRLYFRPRTPTQFHIEGIRKPVDYYMERHAGLLVMLVLDGHAVLTMPNTRFSCGNMQSYHSGVYENDEGFDNLDFAGIYHDEAYPTQEEIRKRCAEVLAESPLSLADSLKAILVRTDADASTLKCLLQREGIGHLVPLVKTSKSTGVFFQRYTAVEYVDISPGRVNFRLKPTYSVGDINTEMAIFDSDGRRRFQLNRVELKPSQNYYSEHNLPPGTYRIVMQLEDCYAHESLVELT